MAGTPPPTARIAFRRWSTSDFELASSLWCDSRVMHFLGGPYSRDEVLARLAREEENTMTYGVQYWPLYVDDVFAGCCGLKPHEPAHGHHEIGFHLKPEFWGEGYGSEAARAVIAYAFEVIGASALFAGHHPQNESSRGLLTRLGFTQIGTHFFARTGLDHPWYRRDR